MRATWLVLFGSLVWLLTPMVLRADDEPSQEPGKPPAGASELEDAPEPLEPAKTPSAEDLDRLEAISLFAAGRTEEEKENFGEALRLYQRALRYDPKAQAVVWQIINLARQIDRPDLAMRYLMLAAEKDAIDPRMLWSLADQLTEQGNFDEALKFYERARSNEEIDKKSVIYLSLTMQIGRLAYLTNHKQQAADAFAEVIAALEHPEDFDLDATRRKALLGDEARTYDIFADAFLEAGRPDDALAAYEHSQKLAPDVGSYAFHRARIHAAKKEYEPALEQLQTYFDSHEVSEEIAPYELLATILEAQGQKDELIERLEKIRAEDPGNVPLRYFLADKYRAAGQGDKAEPHFRDLVKQSPKLEAYRGLIDIYTDQKKVDKLLDTLADAASKMGSFDELNEQVEKIAKDEKLLNDLFDAARAKGKDREDGLPYGEALSMALLADKAKQWDAMSEFFEQAVTARPSATGAVLLAWGQALLAAEKYAEAADVFRRGIEAHAEPGDEPVFHTYLAVALVMGDKVEDALVVAYDAADLGNHSAWLESRVAWILYYAKRYDEAAAHYNDILKRFDEDYSHQAVRRVLRESRLALSNIYVLQKNNAKAEEILQQVLDEYPEDPGALNDLGYLWADQGKHLDRALQMVRAAVEAEPDNAAYRDSLGWALYRLGRFDEALTELQKATAHEDTDGTIQDHLGDIYQALGKTDEARKAWQTGLDLLKKQKDGDPKKIAEIERKIAGDKPDPPETK